MCARVLHGDSEAPAAARAARGWRLAPPAMPRGEEGSREGGRSSGGRRVGDGATRDVKERAMGRERGVGDEKTQEIEAEAEYSTVPARGVYISFRGFGGEAGESEKER